MTAAALLSVWLIHLLAAISPGPSFVVCVRTAAVEGFATSTALAFGFGIGAFLWAAAAMAGLALIFEALPALFVSLRILGGAFLIYIAVMMWRHARAPLPAADGNHTPRSIWQAIRLGFVTFAANLKTAIFFGAVFAGLVPADAPLGARALILLLVFANETLWYIIVARVFPCPGRARPMRA